ncbi:glutamate--tRNA ligase, cytoplasmic [Tanacetum coccineum]
MDLKKLHVLRARKRPEVYLPHAEMGKVCLRFAPEPSGYLHMGYLKAALLNQDFAQRYQGKQIIRFDDTNPAKKNNEFVYNILNDLETMGINYELIFTSDYFPQLIGTAQKLIEEEKAFIHDTPREQMQSEHMARLDSKCTHALRSSEYHDRNDLYLRIQETIGLRKVHIYEFSRLNIVYTPLSKQKLLWFVENEMVDGWDDAHFPTVQGMVRRGLKMDALIQFILEQLGDNEKLIDAEPKR